MDFSNLLDNEKLWARKLKLGSKKQITKDFDKDGLGDILGLFDVKKKKKLETKPKASRTSCDFISIPEIHSTNDMELQKRFRGQLNRLGESNMEKVILALEPLFQTHSRHETTEALTASLLNIISNQADLLEKFIATFSVFITSLSNKIGSHLVFHFIIALVKDLFDLLSHDHTSNNRIIMNFVHMISFLYILQVINTVLIYDLVKYFSNRMDELSVEILLKLLYNAGSQLYKDDPSALRDIILLIHEQKSKLSQDKLDSFRFKFLIDMLDDLKNNKKRLAKDIQNDSIMKSIKPNFASISLTISSILDGNQDGNATSVESLKHVTTNSSDLLLKAQKSMNTDVRRAIFIVIMGAEDYLDACERIIKLQLTTKQTPEIARVLIHCCQHEMSFNPYYSYLSNSLIRNGIVRSKAFTFCLWDTLKAIKNGEMRQIHHIYHLGKLFGFLIRESISIISLKMARFDTIEINPHLFLFLTLIFSDGLLGLTENEWSQTFQKIGKLEQHSSLKEGLIYFFSKWNDKMKQVVTNVDDQSHIIQCVGELLDVMTKCL